MTNMPCYLLQPPTQPQVRGPRRRAATAARIAAMLLLVSVASFSQMPESTYISDLTTAIAGVFAGGITPAGKTLPRVKFSANELPAGGAFLKTFSAINSTNCPTSLSGWGSCPLKLYADGLVAMGVDRIDINIWISPYVTGNAIVQGYYTNLVNYIHSQTCNGHTCEVQLNPEDDSLAELAGGCGTVTTFAQYQTCLTSTTTAMVTMATAGYTQQPEYFTVVHECSTQNTKFGWTGASAGQGTASDWRGFVDTVAAQLSAAHYAGKVGAGGCLYWEDGTTVVGGNVVPNFCGDSTYGFNNDTANLQYITYDVYNANSITGPTMYAANMTSLASGNYVGEIAASRVNFADVRIEESGSPPFVYSYGTGPTASLADIEPNTIVDSYRGCGWNDWNAYGLDRQWLDMIFKFASAQKMTSAAIFYTFPFFAYTTDPLGLDNACNPTDSYTQSVVTNSLGLISATGTYFQNLSAHWPTVIATGSVKLTGSAKLQ